MWVFGYGSLLWNAGFPFVQRIPGQVLGWERRFCQLSPDHRGTEQEPGRTVTLCQGEGPTATCWGVAYKVPEGDVSATVAYLDHREKAGYEMVELDFAPDDPKLETFRVQAYISGETSQFRAPNESDDEVAHVIVHACGPSGRNTEYLLRLADELRKAGVRDEHVEGLAELVVRKAIDERLHADLLEQYARHLGA